MMRFLVPLCVVLLSGCNENTAVGNDRAEQVAPAPTPAPIVGAQAALRNVATAIIKPETMSDADITALGGRGGRCAFKLTEVAFPSFLFEAGETGVIKLNGKLIPVPATAPARFEDGGLVVTLELLEDEGNAGLQGMEMIVVAPGAQDELGYRGYVQCFDMDEDTR